MALEGSLHDMSLVDLIQVFQMGPKTGVLRLVGHTERGVIYVAAGNLIDAVAIRSEQREVVAAGEEAVLHLLQWEEATFNFRHDADVTQRPIRIAHDSEWLVLEGMRRRENPVKLQPHQQITAQTRLELSPLPSGTGTGVNLDLDQWRLLSQVSVCESLAEICENAGMTLDKAIRTASELVAIGLIEVVAPPKPKPARPASRAQETYTPLATAPSRRPASMGAPESTPNAPLAGRALLGAIMRRIQKL